MKISIYSFLFLGLIFFSACSKSNEKDSFEDKDDLSEEFTYEEACFELVYPISYTMPDGSTLTGNKEELERQIKGWYTNHPDSKEKYTLNYPVQIIFEDKDGRVDVMNEQEMKRWKEACDDKDDDEWDDKDVCFELVYPISYTMPDGSTLTGNKEELERQIKGWYANHPDSKEKYTLNYPVQIVFEDRDDRVDVMNEEEMKRWKATCDDNEEEEACFDMVFPLSFEMPDGTTITGETERELDSLIEEWFENHPDNKEDARLIFPVDIVFEDGMVNTVNSNEELRRAFADCE